MTADDAGAPLLVAPVVPKGLQSAAAAVESARGLLAVSWAQGGGALALNVTLPPGVGAEVVLPFPSLPAPLPASLVVTEGGAAVWRGGAFVPGAAPGVLGAEQGDGTWPLAWGALRVRIASGSYSYIAGNA